MLKINGSFDEVPGLQEELKLRCECQGTLQCPMCRAAFQLGHLHDALIKAKSTVTEQGFKYNPNDPLGT